MDLINKKHCPILWVNHLFLPRMGFCYMLLPTFPMQRYLLKIDGDAGTEHSDPLSKEGHHGQHMTSVHELAIGFM